MFHWKDQNQTDLLNPHCNLDNSIFPLITPLLLILVDNNRSVLIYSKNLELSSYVPCLDSLYLAISLFDKRLFLFHYTKKALGCQENSGDL